MKKHLQLLRHGVGNMHSMEWTANPGARHWIGGVGGGQGFCRRSRMFLMMAGDGRKR